MYSLFFIFTAEQYSTIRSPLRKDGHLGCFQSSIIADSAGMNRNMNTLFTIFVGLPLDSYLEVKLLS